MNKYEEMLKRADEKYKFSALEKKENYWVALLLSRK